MRLGITKLGIQRHSASRAGPRDTILHPLASFARVWFIHFITDLTKHHGLDPKSIMSTSAHRMLPTEATKARHRGTRLSSTECALPSLSMRRRFP